MAQKIDVCRLETSCMVGVPVELRAGGYSLNPNRAITYTWSVVASPNSSAADYQLLGGDSPLQTLIPLVAGCFTVRVLCCVLINAK